MIVVTVSCISCGVQKTATYWPAQLQVCPGGECLFHLPAFSAQGNTEWAGIHREDFYTSVIWCFNAPWTHWQLKISQGKERECSLMCKSPCKWFFRATVNMKNEALQTWRWVTHPILPAYLYMFGTSNIECHYLFNKQMLFEKLSLMHFNIPCTWILEQCGAWQRQCFLNLGLFSSVQWKGLLLRHLSNLSFLQVMTI